MVNKKSASLKTRKITLPNRDFESENQELDLQIKNKQIRLEEDMVNIEKINTLRFLLSESVVSNEKTTIISSEEQNFKPIFEDENDIFRIKAKIFSLINKM